MKLLKPGSSIHHLFTYHEVRSKLIQIYGNPVSEEDHIWLQNEIRKIRKILPMYYLDKDFHNEIHKKEKDKFNNLYAQTNNKTRE